MTRSTVMTGNWKMNKTIDEASTFVEGLLPLLKDVQIEVGLAVPFTSIHPLFLKVKGSALQIGAQNMNDVSEGAFTGEIAGKMLKNAGATFVILGHSERRRLYCEDNAFIHRKVVRAIETDLRPILCIGETLEEHEEGRVQAVVKTQLIEGLKDIKPEKLKHLIIAYEPVWAIGTGKSASAEEAQETHHYCREVLGEILGSHLADQIPIQYGGSVSVSNAVELMKQPDIDGLLIGGASLSLESFSKIMNDISNERRGLDSSDSNQAS